MDESSVVDGCKRRRRLPRIVCVRAPRVHGFCRSFPHRVSQVSVRTTLVTRVRFLRMFGSVRFGTRCDETVTADRCHWWRVSFSKISLFRSLRSTLTNAAAVLGIRFESCAVLNGGSHEIVTIRIFPGPFERKIVYCRN